MCDFIVVLERAFNVDLHRKTAFSTFPRCHSDITVVCKRPMSSLCWKKRCICAADGGVAKWLGRRSLDGGLSLICVYRLYSRSVCDMNSVLEMVS